MTQETLSAASQAELDALRKANIQNWMRFLRFSLVRLLSLFVTVAIGVYLTILVANMGGRMDDIRRSQIQGEVDIAVGMDPANRNLTSEQRNAMIADMVAVRERQLGLDQPFFQRSTRLLMRALTLDLGNAEQIVSDSGSRSLRLIILERLGPTLILFGVANLIIFGVSLFFALALSRRYGSFWDKAIVALSPTSAAPGWFYGLFLILIFSALLRWLPFGGMVAAPPPPDRLGYLLSMGRHLILPVTALVISAVFLSIYSWRTFFLIYSSEDYVDMARAKGLPDKMIERRYILRPTLPFILTSFMLTLIGMWQGGIILERVFNWPGLGGVIFRAIGLVDTPVIVATTVIYAYLLALTVFVLDFVYALVDPRVRVGGGSRN
jgi:peptide/nickel transport system permease protein